MRTYLVVIDDSPEAGKAIRFAARRAQHTGGGVHILSIAEQAAFVAFGGIQATIEADAEAHAVEIVQQAAGEIVSELGTHPQITVKTGDAIKMVREILEQNPDISMLVLGAAAQGAPGPLVTYFTGNDCGTLSCPVIVIPGGLDDALIEQLSAN